MAYVGKYGTPVSFHQGNSAKMCIVVASGAEPDAIVRDLMEVADKQSGYRFSSIPAHVSIRRDGGRIYVTGEGGDVRVVISAMVDAVCLLQENGEATALVA